MVSNSSENYYLKVLSKTWSRDSHGLFDYEAPNMKIFQNLISCQSVLIRKKNEVKSGPESSELDLEDRELCKVKYEDGKFFLSNPVNFFMQANEREINELQNKIWYVIRQEDAAGGNPPPNFSFSANDVYDIKINDIIKLGRVKYAITEIKLNSVLKTIDKDADKPIFNLICDYNKHTELNSDVLCKICLANQEEKTNPMISLCKCAGTISYVHYQCLKFWMQTKLTIKENEKKTVTSYSMKSFNCEICKTPYPLRFRYDNTFYDIIDCTRPTDKNYIILESLNQLKENNNQKSIQVITLENDERIIMGRGHETDVRINDISVSRTHALLILTNEKIYIKDLKSKFGTLVLLQEDIEATEKVMCLQIGRTYLECSTQRQIDINKNKKEVPVKTGDDKEKPGTLKGKQLFQVEKPDIQRKNSTKKAKPNNAMDVDAEIFPQNFDSSRGNNQNNNNMNNLYSMYNAILRDRLIQLNVMTNLFQVEMDLNQTQKKDEEKK